MPPLTRRGTHFNTFKVPRGDVSGSPLLFQTRLGPWLGPWAGPAPRQPSLGASAGRILAFKSGETRGNTPRCSRGISFVIAQMSKSPTRPGTQSALLSRHSSGPHDGAGASASLLHRVTQGRLWGPAVICPGPPLVRRALPPGRSQARRCPEAPLPSLRCPGHKRCSHLGVVSPRMGEPQPGPQAIAGPCLAAPLVRDPRTSACEEPVGDNPT